MDMTVFNKYKIIAYVSYNLILHYVHICKYFDMYMVRFKIKTFHGGHYDHIELQISLEHNFEDNAHQTFFTFFDEYYKRSSKNKLFIPPYMKTVPAFTH